MRKGLIIVGIALVFFLGAYLTGGGLAWAMGLIGFLAAIDGIDEITQAKDEV